MLVTVSPKRMLFRPIIRWCVLVLPPVCISALVLTLVGDGALMPDALFGSVLGIGALAAVLSIASALLYVGLVKPAATEFANF